MRLALYQPDQPGNVGTILRLGACFGVPVDIIEPCGFAFSDRALKRAAMDYARAWPRSSGTPTGTASSGRRPGRIVLLTTRGDILLPDARFEPDDIMLLGSESRGVPDRVHDRADLRIRIPQATGIRSLNIAVAAGIALAEALRQTEDGRNDRAGLRADRRRAPGSNRCATASAPSSRRSRPRRAATARFDYTPWDRHDDSDTQGGGGVRGLMKGAVFEKVGVNVSTVGGTVQPRIRADDPRRGRGPALLRDRHQPGRAYGQSARAGRPYEHALPVHAQALVRRRRRPQSADPL